MNPILVVDDANAGYTPYQSASLTLDLAAGDYIALGAYHETGGAMDVIFGRITLSRICP